MVWALKSLSQSHLRVTLPSCLWHGNAEVGYIVWWNAGVCCGRSTPLYVRLHVVRSHRPRTSRLDPFTFYDFQFTQANRHGTISSSGGVYIHVCNCIYPGWPIRPCRPTRTLCLSDVPNTLCVYCGRWDQVICAPTVPGMSTMKWFPVEGIGLMPFGSIPVSCGDYYIRGTYFARSWPL